MVLLILVGYPNFRRLEWVMGRGGRVCEIARHLGDGAQSRMGRCHLRGV